MGSWGAQRSGGDAARPSGPGAAGRAGRGAGGGGSAGPRRGSSPRAAGRLSGCPVAATGAGQPQGLGRGAGRQLEPRIFCWLSLRKLSLSNFSFKALTRFGFGLVAVFSDRL